MAYDEKLAERVRGMILGLGGVSEKKMFGGLCFLMRGNMVCGVAGDRLMVRTGPERHEAALKRKHAKPMDFTGKPMKGLIWVEPQGIKTKAQLAKWLSVSLDFVKTLPEK